MVSKCFLKQNFYMLRQFSRENTPNSVGKEWKAMKNSYTEARGGNVFPLTRARIVHMGAGKALSERNAGAVSSLSGL